MGRQKRAKNRFRSAAQAYGFPACSTRGRDASAFVHYRYLQFADVSSRTLQGEFCLVFPMTGVWSLKAGLHFRASSIRKVVA